MITDNEIQELIDGSLTEERAGLLRKQINGDEVLLQRYTVFKNIDSVLSDQALPETKPGFTESVMRNLPAAPLPETIKPELFWKRNLIMVLGIIAVCSVAALVLLSQFSLAEVIPSIEPQQIILKEKTFTIDPNIGFRQELFFKGLIYLNAFLCIFLLEKAVLRPFFKRRRQQYAF